MATITGVSVRDVRVPTSRELDGSDAMNRDPDHSAAYVDHLHEHFVDPAVIRNGRDLTPETPGFSAEIRPASLAEFEYPDGAAWTVTADREDR